MNLTLAPAPNVCDAVGMSKADETRANQRYADKMRRASEKANAAKAAKKKTAREDVSRAAAESAGNALEK